MSFFDDLGAAVGGAFCTWLGGVGNAESWLQRSAGLSPGGVGAGIRGALCDDPTPPPPNPKPFEGGQCPGTVYTVSTIRGDDTGLFRPQVTGLIGPVTAISYDREPVPGDITRTFIRMDVTAANGQFFDSLTYLHAPNSPPSTSPDVAATSGPDDCGDPSPVIPEFEPPTLPITVPDPGGGPDIDLDLTINAPIVIGPNVFAPVSITGPDINFNGTIELNPDFNINIGSGLGGGGGGFGGEVGSDGEDLDPESPSEPPQADGRKIIGLIVTLNVSEDVRATELAQDGDVGSIGVPRIAIAYLVSNNGGVRVPLSGVDLKLRNTYIPVPPDVEVVSWRIHTEQGVSVARVRPVYGTTQPAT